MYPKPSVIYRIQGRGYGIHNANLVPVSKVSSVTVLHFVVKNRPFNIQEEGG